MATTSSTTGTTTTAPVSIASSSSSAAAGGSVINVNSLVSQLVAATRAPQDAQIATQTSAVTATISAVGTLKSALSTFQSSLTALSTPGAFSAEKATSSDPTVFTATTDSGAAPGAYGVNVISLAQAMQLVSAAFSGGLPAIGTGHLTVALGSTTFTVAIDGSNNTISGVASAINSAIDNPGVTASVIQGTDGAHLLLSSSLTGAANTIQLSESDGGTGLSALTYGSGNTSHYTAYTPAADASFSIAGVPHTSAGNTVTDAISGVTLNLVGKSSGTANSTLTVGNDTSTVEANIQSFVTAYNALQGQFTTLGSYDSTTGKAGTLLGDSLLSGTQNQIRQALYSVVGSSNYNSLASVGITTNSDGTLSVNNSRLETALSSNFQAVSRLFSGTNGVAAQLNTRITNELASGGIVDSRSKTLVKQENALTDKTDKLDDQMTALTASLTQQYSTLNTLLSSLQSMSSYLSQAFATLPSAQKSSN